MNARTIIILPSDGQWRGSASPGHTEPVRCVQETTGPDILFAAGAITEAQHDTAMAIYGQWVDAGLAPRASGWFGSGGGWDGADDAPTARDRYRAMMRRLTTVQVLAVERMLWGLGVPAAMLAEVRAGLDLLEGIRCDE